MLGRPTTFLGVPQAKWQPWKTGELLASPRTCLAACDKVFLRSAGSHPCLSSPQKQAMLEKKMAHHLRKLQERFQREGLLPPGSMFPADALEDQGPEPKRRGTRTRVVWGSVRPHLLMGQYLDEASSAKSAFVC